jgi:Mrp family chromosome partitioning ATPase
VSEADSRQEQSLRLTPEDSARVREIRRQAAELQLQLELRNQRLRILLLEAGVGKELIDAARMREQPDGTLLVVLPAEPPRPDPSPEV